MVMVSPLLMSPSLVSQSSRPVAASSAIVRSSSVLKKNRPLASTPPRLTTSQQATPCEDAAGFGLYIHFSGAPGLVRSSA